METNSIDSGYFESFDSTQLLYRFFSASSDPQNHHTLIIVHGHGEHSGRYLKFAEKLKDPAVNIAVYDLRGQGQSGGPEVSVQSFEQFENDLSAFLIFLRKRYGMKERFILLGHSLGGLIAVNWTMKNQNQIKGLILSSPCLGLTLPGFLIAFNRFLRRFSPLWIYRNPVYPKHLTHDSLEVALYKSDPLIKRKISVSLLDEMLRYALVIESLSRFDLEIPFYLFLAGDERIVDGKKSLTFYNKVNAPVKEKYIFDGLYHEIFNETGQDKVFARLSESLLSILSYSQ